MSYPLLKILSLVATAATHYFSTTPPLPPPKPEERVFKRHPFETVLPALRFGTMVCVHQYPLETLAYPGL